MFKLKNWLFTLHGKSVIAHGDVYDNPKFSDGDFIHTSFVNKVEVIPEGLLITTKSESIYFLEADYISIRHFDETEICFKSLGLETDLLESYMEKTKERKTLVLKEMNEKLKPRELYLSCQGVSVKSAYFCKENDEVIEANITYHAGMFTDSVLVRAVGEVDFRFFPKYNMIDLYHWSDGLDRVIIYNQGEDFDVKESEKYISCKRGTETIIESKDYSGEGLFSPDCVNGKSALSKMIEEEE